MPSDLLSVARVAPMTVREARELEDLARRGALLSAAFQISAGSFEAIMAAKRFVYRRWVLQAALTLLEGPAGFNQLRRTLGGLAGESLSLQLESLHRARLVDRTVQQAKPLRVAYSLTSTGTDLAMATFVLTHGHTERVRAATPSHGSAVAFPTTAPRGPIPGFERAKRDFVQRAKTFTRARMSARQGSHESALETAHRFSELCVRRWHGDVMNLLLQGPRSFAQIKGALGVGDQSLADALHALQELGSVTKMDNRYQLQATGRFALMLGTPLIAIAWSAIRTAPPGAT